MLFKTSQDSSPSTKPKTSDVDLDKKESPISWIRTVFPSRFSSIFLFFKTPSDFWSAKSPKPRLLLLNHKKSKGFPLASTLSTNQLLVVTSIIFLFWWLFHLLFLFFFSGLTCHLFLFTTLVEWFYCFFCVFVFLLFRCACHIFSTFFPSKHHYFSTKAEKNTTTPENRILFWKKSTPPFSSEEKKNINRIGSVGRKGPKKTTTNLYHNPTNASLIKNRSFLSIG